MHVNYQQPDSIIRTQLKNESSSITEETYDVEEESTTIKPREVVDSILDDNNYLFRVNRNRYGFRLSYEDKKNPLCFVSLKKINQKK